MIIFLSLYYQRDPFIFNFYRQQRWRCGGCRRCGRREHLPTAIPGILCARWRSAVFTARSTAETGAARFLLLFAVSAAGRAGPHVPLAVHAARAVRCFRISVSVLAATSRRRRTADAGSFLESNSFFFFM